MKRMLSLIIAALLLLGLMSCGSTAEEKEKSESMNYPEWFLQPPTSDESIYATAVATKKGLQLAKDVAISTARDEIARVVRVQVSNMVKNFVEQAGVNDESQYTEFSSTVSKQIADEALSGSKQIDAEIVEKDGVFTFYALVELKLADMTGRFDELLAQQAAAYSKLRATKGFDELKEELKALRGEDYGTPEVITAE